MGLDISVYRLGHKSDFVKYDTFNITSLSDDGKSLSNHKDIYPEWALSLSENIIEEYYDFEKYKELAGIDILNDYEWCMTGPLYSNKDIFGHVFRNKETKTEIEVPSDDIPIKKVEVEVVYFDANERGYMRKGLNSKFYDDYEAGICKYFVWDRIELLRILDEYVIEERKEEFKRNIIDNFEEGKDVVTFDW